MGALGLNSSFFFYFGLGEKILFEKLKLLSYKFYPNDTHYQLNVESAIVLKILKLFKGLPNSKNAVEQKAKAANNAIAAAQSIKKSWTDPNQLVNGAANVLKQTANEKGIAPHMTPHLYPSLPADIGTIRNSS